MLEAAQLNRDDLLEQVIEVRKRLAVQPMPSRFDLNQKTLDFLRLITSPGPYSRPCSTMWGFPLHVDNTLPDGAVRPIY